MRLSKVEMKFMATVFDTLTVYNSQASISNTVPLSFEYLNHSYGFMLYSSKITFQPTDPAVLSIPTLHDRAQVFIDKVK